MTDRPKQARRALPALLLVTAAVAAPTAVAAPAAVKLRVEGASSTLFEDQITTDGHNVTTASGGTHKCDGTNGGVNPSPGPSATAALDDGARLGGFSWDGTYDSGFDDYLVSRIGPDSQTSTLFWGLLVDSEFSSVGGCQQRVASDEEVLWAFDGFGKAPLHLSGPSAANTGKAFEVKVTDGASGAPLAGAGVGGAVSGADGRAKVTLNQKGIYRLKAERADSIRSNALSVCVDPAGAAPCTSFDSSAPRIDLTLPGDYASDGSRSRTMRIEWLGEDGAGGSGVTTYDAAVRNVSDAADPGPWTTLANDTVLTRTHFRGDAGATYEFRVNALDRARNLSRFADGTVTVPVDDRARRRIRISRGWKRLARKGAWGGHVLRSRAVGARARMRFEGTAVAVIGRKLPKGGRLRVSIDGRSRVIRLRGTPRFRRVLFTSKRRARGTHTVRLKALGGGKVEIDAIAPLP